MRETTALIYSPKMTTKFSFKLDNINISFSMSAGGSLKNVTLEWGGLADVIRGVKFAKILLTSYVNAP